MPAKIYPTTRTVRDPIDGALVKIMFRGIASPWSWEYMKQMRLKAIAMFRAKGWDSTADRIERQTLREWLLHPDGGPGAIISACWILEKGQPMPPIMQPLVLKK
jgi:hypothetical protein